MSHANLSEKIASFSMISSDDVLLCYSSMYWRLSGVLILLTGTLFGAKRVITTQLSSPELQFRMIEQYKVTFMLTSSYQATLLSKNELIKTADLSSLKYYMTGGNRIPKSVPIRINKYLPNGKVHIAYGLSEIAGMVSFDYPGIHAKDAVGQLTAGMHVKIIDVDGNRCGINGHGEICVKGPVPNIGYYNNQAANNELFDAEAFLRTSDIGYFDQDGYLYIVDRKADMLKYLTFKISPSYIEAHLINHHSFKQCALLVSLMHCMVT